jgi:peptidoglycan/xylan/chitin deacetylase (PgdA/CDA1 family)
MPTILTYHHIAEPPAQDPHRGLFVSPDQFAAQVDYLAQRDFEVVGLDAVREHLLGERELPKRSVAITFDDGTGDNYTAAFPVLQRHNFPATVFLIAGKVGQFRKNEGWPPETLRYLNRSEILEMAESGIAFGSHTLTHARLARANAETLSRELGESKRVIEEILDRPIGWICYPWGSFSPAVIDAAKAAGYLGATSTIRDNRLRPEQLYFLPRVMVMPDIPLRRFAYYFSPLYHWIHWFKNRRRWSMYAGYSST